MALAITRLDSLNTVTAMFERGSTGTNMGAWLKQESGSTPEADTGPGTNSGGPYIYCNAQGVGFNDVAAIKSGSLLTLRDYLMDDWTGFDRRLHITYCQTGAAFNNNLEGIEIEVLVNGTWQHQAQVIAWPYSDTYEKDGLLTDNAGIQHSIDLDGGWVDVELPINNAATGLRIFLNLLGTLDVEKSQAGIWDIGLLDGSASAGRTSQLRFPHDYELLVDWDNDGSYGNAHADIWPRVIEDTFECRRGRNFASQRTGRSVAGRLTVELDNRDGLLDPDNAMSALSGLLGGGRRVQWQVNDGDGNLEPQWTGWLRGIRQIDEQTGLDRVQMQALGVISRLDPPRGADRVQQNRYVAEQTDQTVGTNAKLLFDATADAAIYDAQYINGNRQLSRWWSDKPRLRALRDLEQAEGGGFLWERKDGLVALDAGDRRQTAASRVLQAMFVDTNPSTGEIPAIADGIHPDHPHEDLANIIISRVAVETVGVEQVLWSVAELPIEAGADFEVAIEYPGPLTFSNHVGVDTWTDLTAGTDYTAQTGVTLTLTKLGNEATIRVQNTGAATTMDIQLRGQPLIRTGFRITTQDDDSVDEHGPAPYPFETPWLSDPAEVRSLHTFLLRVYSQPAERLTLTWEAESDRDKATELDLSDRVEVTRRGIATDYFIESIRHRVTADWHFITLTLSPAGIYGQVFIWGSSAFGGGHFWGP